MVDLQVACWPNAEVRVKIDLPNQSGTIRGRNVGRLVSEMTLTKIKRQFSDRRYLP
jgi:hypothetical protein